MSAEERALPLADPDSERAVIGTFLAGHYLADVTSVQEDDFATPNYAMIFRAVAAVRARGAEINQLSVSEAMRDRRDDRGQSDLEKVGGPAALMELDMAALYSDHGVADQVARLKDLGVRRRARRTYIEHAGRLFDMARPANELVLECSGAIAALCGGAISGWRTLTEVLQAEAERIDRIQRLAAGAARYIPTGFADMDQALGGGLARGQVTLIAAHPGVGKSGLIGSVALSMARRGQRSGIFKLEERASELGRRAMALATGLEVPRMYNPGLTEDEIRLVYERPAEFVARYNSDGVLLDDGRNQSVLQVASKIRQAHARENIDAFLVDHLIKMANFDDMLEARDVAFGRVIVVLGDLAEELDVAIGLATHLKDPGDPRVDARHAKPKLTDVMGGRMIDRLVGGMLGLYFPLPPPEPAPPRDPPEPRLNTRATAEERATAQERWEARRQRQTLDYERDRRQWQERVAESQQVVCGIVLKGREGVTTGREFRLRRIPHAGLFDPDPEMLP